MNLSLSNRIRQMSKRKFFTEREYQPCWYAVLEVGEKRKQYKWKVGVKFGMETEDHLYSLSGFDVDNDEVWATIASAEFAKKLIDIFRSEGKNAVKEWLKDESID